MSIHPSKHPKLYSNSPISSYGEALAWPAGVLFSVLSRLLSLASRRVRPISSTSNAKLTFWVGGSWWKWRSWFMIIVPLTERENNMKQPHVNLPVLLPLKMYCICIWGFCLVARAASPSAFDHIRSKQSIRRNLYFFWTTHTARVVFLFENKI